MDFTYSGYRQLLSLLKKNDYEIASYHNWEKKERCAILRHDIDYRIEDAIALAKIEQKCAVRSTYFILISSDFYNIFSSKNRKLIRELYKMGHEIGLHFDEAAYPEIEGNIEKIQERILYEINLLENMTGISVKTVSMHRPSKEMLDADLHIPNIVNSYSNLFFKQFKYLSDSRRHWREPVASIIQSKKYNRLHILTHSFWYHDVDWDLSDAVTKFIDEGRQERYISMKENITDLESVIFENESEYLTITSIEDELNAGLLTDRLCLRKFTISDVSDMYEYTSDADTVKFLTWGPHKELSEAETFIQKALCKYKAPTDIQWGIELMEGHKLIGAIRIYNIDFCSSIADVSYILNRKYTGNGYMTEALAAVIKMCHTKMGIRTVCCDFVEPNTASQNVMLRCKMKQMHSLIERKQNIKGKSFTLLRYEHRGGNTEE